MYKFQKEKDNIIAKKSWIE